MISTHPSTRVAVNTFIQYVRIGITAIITLYTSRIVLANLGVENYGIYSLIGGIVTLLAFIQNDLSRTIQRYFSYYQGKGDRHMLVVIFNNSLCIQLLVSMFLCVGLILLSDVILNHLVNIPAGCLKAARWVYWLTVGSLFVNMLSIPYFAMLITHENILYSSIIQTVDAVLKIPVAISLICISSHKLEWYSLMSFLVIGLNFCCYYVYCKRKYEECCSFSFRSFDKKFAKKMCSFMSWNNYGTACVIGRTQGTAILLNRFFGTAINAAFGISGQVSGQINFLSNALTTAISPQIIKSEGAGNRLRMFRLSEISCKFSFLLTSIVAIPVVIYMPAVLGLWLEEVPEHTAMFCVAIILSNQMDLITLNLSNASLAIGNVKTYNICINTIKILALPVIYHILKQGRQPIDAMIVFFIFETICTISRLVFMHISVKYSISQYIRNVFLGVLPTVIVNVTACFLVNRFLSSGGGLLLSGLVSLVVTCLMTYYCGLISDERIILHNITGKFIKQIKR